MSEIKHCKRCEAIIGFGTLFVKVEEDYFHLSCAAIEMARLREGFTADDNERCSCGAPLNGRCMVCVPCGMAGEITAKENEIAALRAERDEYRNALSEAKEVIQNYNGYYITGDGLKEAYLDAIAWESQHDDLLAKHTNAETKQTDELPEGVLEHDWHCPPPCNHKHGRYTNTCQACGFTRRRPAQANP